MLDPGVCGVGCGVECGGRVWKAVVWCCIAGGGPHINNMLTSSCVKWVWLLWQPQPIYLYALHANTLPNTHTRTPNIYPQYILTTYTPTPESPKRT